MTEEITGSEEELPDIESEAEAGEDGSGKGKNRRLTDSEWAEVKELYELGSVGLTDLADKYGISRQGLSKRFRENGVVRGSRAAEAAEAARKAAAASSVAPAAAVAAAERFAQRRPDFIEETKLQGYQLLKQARLLAAKTMGDAVKASKPLSSIDEDLKAIQRFNKIIVDNLAASELLLDSANFTDDEDLPSLTIEDLTDQDIVDHFIDINALPEGSTIEDYLEDKEAVEKELADGGP